MAILDSIKAIRQWLDRLEQECQELLAPAQSNLPDDQPEHVRIAWGAKVSPVFKERVLWIADSLGCDPNWLMACMAWESGESFAPDKKNMAGSGAVGLIQFMPSTAKTLGTNTVALSKMTAEEQLRFVYEYFKPSAGRLHNLGDVYMTILWPKAVGKEDNFVLFDRSKTPTTFRQNAGLDVNHDGLVTRAECLVKVSERLARGLLPENIG